MICIVVGGCLGVVNGLTEGPIAQQAAEPANVARQIREITELMPALKSAWFVVIAVPLVLFTFVGVNTLLPGLHSYGRWQQSQKMPPCLDSKSDTEAFPVLAVPAMILAPVGTFMI